MKQEESSKCLYVFLDEAGDFNFSPTGTKFFTLTAVTKTRPFDWDALIMSLKYDLIETGLNIEYFHAAEDRQGVRDRVFKIVGESLPDSRIDGLIIEKRKTGPALQIAEKFYPRMIGYLLRYILEPRNLRDYAEVIVLTDSIPVSRKREAVEKAIKQTLSRMLPAGTKYMVLHHASKSCAGLQIVDYCNWAIFRKWERGDSRSYDLIRTGIRSEFDIFRSGTRYYY
jgi:hypothetical protein